MALLQAVGDELVGQDELAERGALGQLEEDDGARSLAPERYLVNMSGEPMPFTPVGVGKPLTIELQKIYRGDHGKRGWLGKPDLVCVSATRSTTQFGKAPRAINLVDDNFDPAKRNHRIHASKDGTTVLFHTPSVTEPSQVLTFEMLIDRFSKEGIEQLASAVRSAAGLPVFASASLFMLTGSSVLKLFASLGKCLFDTQPFFVGSHDIRFGVPPFSNNTAGQFVLVNDEDEEEFGGYQIRDDGTLVEARSGESYSGDCPYVSITLDGAPRPDLTDFQAAEASAELLGRFRSESDASAPSEDLLQAAKLLNDFKLRQKAESLRQQVESIGDPEDVGSQKLAELLKANVRRISNPIFREGL